MKSASLFILALATLLSGCSFRQSGVVLEPIGPAPGQPVVNGSQGSLRIFSAFDSAPDFNSLPYRRHYSMYTILAPDGRVLIKVDNRTVPRESPDTVPLPVGAYQVRARANGYGIVTVPVVIKPDQITTVHLEGGSSWPDSGTLAQSNPVRLPHGEMAGWRASNP